MQTRQGNWLERRERLKLILLGGGTKGGTGKSLGLGNIFTWYGYKYHLVPRVFDCDSMQTLTRMIGAESLFSGSEEIPLQWVLGEVLAGLRAFGFHPGYAGFVRGAGAESFF